MNLVVIMHLVLPHKIYKYTTSAVAKLYKVSVLRAIGQTAQFLCMAKPLQEKLIQCSEIKM